MSSATITAAAKANCSRLRHVYESQQFTVPLLMELFDRTRQMEKIVALYHRLRYY